MRVARVATPQVPEHVEEWVDLRLAEGYDGSIILEALDWVEHSSIRCRMSNVD